MKHTFYVANWPSEWQYVDIAFLGESFSQGLCITGCSQQGHILQSHYLIMIISSLLLSLLLLLLSLLLLSTSQGDLYFHLPRDPTPPIPYHCATSVFDLLLQKFLGEIIKLNLLLFQNDSNNIFSLSDIETIAGLDCCGKRQILTECPPQTLTLVDGLSWLFPWFSCPCQLSSFFYIPT